MSELKDYDFGGITLVKRDPTTMCYDDRFSEEYNDDGEVLLVSNEEYTHEDDSEIFNGVKYKLFIQVIDLYNSTGSVDLEGKVIISSGILISPECLTDSIKKSLKESLDGNEPTYMDSFFEGSSVPLLEETLENIDLNDDLPLTNTQVLNKVVYASYAVESANSLRGFYLDRFITPIFTGWDYLRQHIDNDFNFSDFLAEKLAH